MAAGVLSLLALMLWLGWGSPASIIAGTVEAVSIPAQYDGFAYPPLPSAARVPVVLEKFVDATCPDCRSAWPTIKALVELYGSALTLIIHPFPVPFHHNAFFAARALHIANSLNASATIPLLELIYENQESFGADATANETPSSVAQRFISLGVEAGLSPHEVWKGFLDSTTDQATRSSFKYGCSRYVTSTPSYLVNGVPIEADETWSVGKWRSVLEPLISGKSTFSEASTESDGAQRKDLYQR